MATLEADLLFNLDMRITGGEAVGVTPKGTRVIAYVKGTFEGPGLKGTVENGADWYLLRSDGVGELDVRLTMKTDDGEYIYMNYTGIAVIPPEVLAKTAPGQLPSGKMDTLRTAVRFETSSKKYERLNKVQAIGIGKADTSAGTVGYAVYALK
ncbi:MAG: DUF3237 domain-containing protein [Deltaproteobacteria bacterium]|nr:DUF3237 domain-containing protein [Deltaproteobacteria bacterium]